VGDPQNLGTASERNNAFLERCPNEPREAILQEIGFRQPVRLTGATPIQAELTLAQFLGLIDLAKARAKVLLVLTLELFPHSLTFSPGFHETVQDSFIADAKHAFYF
jgi:hypothetical protein